jgi:hypothetical protein
VEQKGENKGKEIMNFLKSNYKKIIGVVVICLILVIAYWYGGNSPGSRGFGTSSVENNTTQDVSDNSEAMSEEASDNLTLGAVSSTQEEADSTQEASQSDITENTTEAATEKFTESAEADSGEKTSEALKEATTGKDKASTDKAKDKTKDKTTEAVTEKNSNKTTEASTEKSTDNKKTPAGNKDNATTEAAAGEENTYTCTISIYCSTILNNMDMLDPVKTSCVPADGCILGSTTVEFENGDTVFDILQKVTRDKGIQLEYTYTAIYGSVYIEGINNLYEFDCGELSGWEYSVNGSFPGYGCSKYVLSDGDVIRWVYTCDLGADIGNYYGN